MTKKRTCHLGIMMGSAVMYVQLVQDKLGSTSSQLNNIFGANFLSSSYNCFCYVRANTVFLILNWVNIEGDRDSQDFWGFLAILVQLLTLQTKWTELSYDLIFHYSSFYYIEILLACFSHSNSHITVQKLKIVILCWCHWNRVNILCVLITHSLQCVFWNELIVVHIYESIDRTFPSFQNNFVNQ